MGGFKWQISFYYKVKLELTPPGLSNHLWTVPNLSRTHTEMNCSDGKLTSIHACCCWFVVSLFCCVRSSTSGPLSQSVHSGHLGRVSVVFVSYQEQFSPLSWSAQRPQTELHNNRCSSVPSYLLISPASVQKIETPLWELEDTLSGGFSHILQHITWLFRSCNTVSQSLPGFPGLWDHERDRKLCGGDAVWVHASL